MTFDFGKIKDKRKGRNFLIALVALMLTGCGAVLTSEDINTTLDSIKTAVDEGDNDFIESKINQLKEQAKDIRKKAEKDENYEEKYKAECLEQLCLSYEDLFEAQNALNNLKEMDHVGILGMVSNVYGELDNPEIASNVTDIRKEQATEYAEKIFENYCICIGNLNTAQAGLESTADANIDWSSYETAMGNTNYLLNVIQAEITSGYSDYIQQIFGLSAEDMEDLNKMQAKHGEDPKEFRDNLLTGGEKRDAKKDKWSLQEEVNEFIKHLQTEINEFKDTTVDNAKLLAEQARIGAELRAKQAEQKGWETRIKTGGPKEKVEARKNADQLQDEIDELQKRFDAISSAVDYAAYIKWLEENGYEVPEDEKEPFNEGIEESVGEMSEEEGLKEIEQNGDKGLPEIELGN